MKANKSILAALVLTAVSLPMSALATINNISSNELQTVYINSYNKEVFTMGWDTAFSMISYQNGNGVFPKGLMGVYFNTPNPIANKYSQLVPISTGILNAKSVVATPVKSYVLTESKHVYVWGYDFVTKKSSNVPLKMPLENVIDVAGTWNQAAFIIDPDGDGVGSLMITDFSKDTYYPDLTDVVQISGGSNFFVILKKDGTVYTIGSNDKGQLGVGDTKVRTGAVKVPYLNNVITISGGNAHSIALHDDGSVSTWGENNCDPYGNFKLTMCNKLGYPDTGNTYVPQKVPNLTGVVEVSAGFNTTMVLTKDKVVKATGIHGYSYVSQCINEHRADIISCLKYKGEVLESAAAKFVELPIINVSEISASGKSFFVNFTDGSIKAWGNNLGKLGDGTIYDKNFVASMASPATITNYKVVVNDAPLVPAPIVREDPVTKTPVVVIPPTTPEHVVITPEVNDDNVLTTECKNGNGYGDTNHCHIKVDKINKETGHS